jgi:hypothetical protein
MDKIRVLAELHNTDYVKIGLEAFGRLGNYMGRQVERWTKQDKASETQLIPAMEHLIEWRPKTLPPQERTSIVHGDCRLDNMIFHPTEPRVTAVLDWELATLGDPLADFSYLLRHWANGAIAQLPNLSAHGLPTLDETVLAYSALSGRKRLSDLNWYFAYNTFRLAAITQGFVGRVQEGTARHPDAARAGPGVKLLAEEGRRSDLAQRAGGVRLASKCGTGLPLRAGKPAARQKDHDRDVLTARRWTAQPPSRRAAMNWGRLRGRASGSKLTASVRLGAARRAREWNKRPPLGATFGHSPSALYRP